MPHVIVKLWPGKSEDRKRDLSEAITRDVMAILGHDADAVSVAIEEIAPGDWDENVYIPEILGKWDTLHKRPGYGASPTWATPISTRQR